MKKSATRAGDQSPLPLRLAWPIAALFTIAVPLWVSPSGRESFRVPKLVLFRSEGIVLAALILLAAVHSMDALRRRWSARNPNVLLPLAIVAWAAIVTLASPERRVSIDSFLTVVATAAVYFTAYDAGEKRSTAAAWVVLVPTIINAGAVLLELRPTWDRAFAKALVGEFSSDSLLRITPFAFMGNRDDVAALLVPATIAAIALAVTAGSRRQKVLAASAAVFLALALVATKTLTAIAALAIAVLVLAFLRSWKSGLAGLVIVAVSVTAAFLLHSGLRSRATQIWRDGEAGHYDRVVVGRITPTIAAAAMIRDHALFGVGPGLFGQNYYRYRIEAAHAYPSLVPTSGYIDYFTDAHDDHLQLAAEGGVVAYLLFLAAVITGIAASFRRTLRTGSGAADTGRLIAAPLFIALVVLAATQFPLQLAATLQLFAACAGLSLGWIDHATA